MSEKICVTGYGQTVYFKKPAFDYAQMCIGSDNLIHGQVLNTKQDKWKLKKWNKETGKVIGSERNTATYFDLVPISCFEAIEENTRKQSEVVVSEIKKITESESSATKETVECDGKWNRHYTNATQEAYDLLVAYGYENGETTSTLRNGIQQKGLFLISNNKITWCQKNSFAALSIFKNGKALYTVDGELSATQYSPNEVGFKSGIKELKKKYATGKYDCYYKMSDDAPMWERLINPHLDDKFSEYKLILKEHSHIADAVISNPDVEVEFSHYKDAIRFPVVASCFFESYCENVFYYIKQQPDKGIKTPQYKTYETTGNLEIESDGSSNSFYIFPNYVCDVDSLCRYWNLSSAEGNILKSLTANLGSRHGGTDKKREVRKSLHYAIERMRWNEFSGEEIIAQVQKHFKS